MATTLAPADFRKMNHLARQAVVKWYESNRKESGNRTISESSIEEAAEYLAMVSNNDEYVLLYQEFENGLRNSVVDGHYLGRWHQIEFINMMTKRAATISARP